MKKRHLVLGCGIVLALALAVPALGGPLSLRSGGSGSVKSILKKAQKTAAGAQRLANTAQGAAAGAQGAASGAKAAADAAQKKASDALKAASSQEGSVQNAVSVANDALSLANGKFGGVEEKQSIGAPDGVTREQRAEAACPAGTVLGGGGFKITGEAAEPHVSKPSDANPNGWEVIAQSGGNGTFTLMAIAICLTR